MEVPRPRELLPRVLRIAKRRLRQRRVRIGHPRDVRIAQQRQNRMVVGRRRNLDLAPRACVPVFRQHARQQFVLLIQQHGLVLFREVVLFRRQLFHHGVVCQVLLIHPHELRKQLQIPPILRVEMRHRGFHPARPHPRLQFRQPGPPLQVGIAYLERPLQRLALLFRAKRRRRRERDVEPRLVELPARVLLDLFGEQRNDIECRVYARKFLQYFHHPPIVLQRVQPRPRQQVAPCRRVAILRLVHVPQNGQVHAAQFLPPFSNAALSIPSLVLRWLFSLMRLLDRYIGSEMASHAALGLAVFTFVFFVPQLVHLMDLVVHHSGGAANVALLFLCTLPPVLIFTIPMAVLVGVLIGLGRLSGDSEVVALNAAGISLRRLLVPIGFVAFLGALATLLITFWLSPASLRTLRSLEATILSSQAPYAVEPRVFDDRFPHIVLYVQDVEAAATRWTGVFLATSGGSEGSAITVARDALIITASDSRQMDIHLGSGSTHAYDPRYPARYSVTTFGDTDIPVDFSQAASIIKAAKPSEAEMSVPALLADHGPDWRQARVEFQNRLAFPAACLVFALLGVPVGVHPRRGGRATGVILTLVLISGYYFLWVTGDHLAQQGYVSPAAGIWAANVAALLVGVFLFRRVEKVRKPNPILAWIESGRLRHIAEKRRKSSPAPLAHPATLSSNGPVSLSSASSPANGSLALSRSAAGLPHAAPAERAIAFPLLIDFYLLGQFFFFFSSSSRDSF